MIGTAANGEILLIGTTRLLDVHIHLAHGPHHARCLVHEPARVGVGHQLVRGLQHLTRLMDALNILIRIATHLKLESAVSFLTITRNLARHFLRRLL